MRPCLCLLAAGIWLSAGRAPAQEGEARRLVEKAVKALGGLDRLDRKVGRPPPQQGQVPHRRLHLHRRQLQRAGQPPPPHPHRRGQGRAAVAHPVLVGKRLDGGRQPTFELDAAFLDRINKSIYTDRVCGLVTLLKDKGCTLSPLGESNEQGHRRPRAALQKEGKPDVSLYFDRQTSLLLKSASRVTDANTERGLQEIHYHDYRKSDPAADDEQALRAAKAGADGPALLTSCGGASPSGGRPGGHAGPDPQVGSQVVQRPRAGDGGPAEVRSQGGSAAAPGPARPGPRGGAACPSSAWNG